MINNEIPSMEQLLTMQQIECLRAILKRVLVRGYGKVTIEVVNNGKKIFISEKKTYDPDKQDFWPGFE